MIAALALLLAATQPAPIVATPPADLRALPELSLLRRPAEAAAPSGFVRDEVATGRCVVATHPAGTNTLAVDLAVFVAGNGAVRRIMPRAIDCPTVEQYAVGIAARMTRDNVPAPGVDSWYRMTIAFAW